MGIIQTKILEWVASPLDLPNPGMEPASLTSPALEGRFFTWKASCEADVFRVKTRNSGSRGTQVAEKVGMWHRIGGYQKKKKKILRSKYPPSYF